MARIDSGYLSIYSINLKCKQNNITIIALIVDVFFLYLSFFHMFWSRPSFKMYSRCRCCWEIKQNLNLTDQQNKIKFTRVYKHPKASQKHHKKTVTDQWSPAWLSHSFFFFFFVVYINLKWFAFAWFFILIHSFTFYVSIWNNKKLSTWKKARQILA